jgi:hypothetical protein
MSHAPTRPATGANSASAATLRLASALEVRHRTGDAKSKLARRRAEKKLGRCT